MPIPLDRLIAFKGNRYIFTRAAMMMVDRLGNIQGYPEEDENWKVVPNILDMILTEKLKYNVLDEE